MSLVRHTPEMRSGRGGYQPVMTLGVVDTL